MTTNFVNFKLHMDILGVTIPTTSWGLRLFLSKLQNQNLYSLITSPVAQCLGLLVNSMLREKKYAVTLTDPRVVPFHLVYSLMSATGGLMVGPVVAPMQPFSTSILLQVRPNSIPARVGVVVYQHTSD